jgi:hypothetical protein
MISEHDPPRKEPELRRSFELCVDAALKIVGAWVFVVIRSMIGKIVLEFLP